KTGHRQIAAVTNASFLSITKERLRGYRTALTDNDIPVNEDRIKYCHHGGMILAEVEEAVSQLMNNTTKPDAILATSDKLTTGCLRVLKAKGINVPNEMGLVGFSNTDLTELLDPPLTVIKQPAFEMGQLATTLLIQLIESKRPVLEMETRMLATELIIRGSSLSRKGKQKSIA
ncbi:MAG TPA: substrate-binding domain-containing protein, partial [Chitinophagaceae bacterium]|nr:substrate-binding domain-containing protein [Chitinophagaceae bacterium]